MSMVTAVLVLCGALGSAECELPEKSAGTALDQASIKGYAVLEGDEQFLRFAPIILVEHYEISYNHVGTPAARLDADGDEDIYIDPTHATYYLQEQPWETEHGKYKNLIYRVHFEESRPNNESTDGGRGKNVGLMLVVTLDEGGKPLFLNAVHTCGCFHALLPTSFLPNAAYPEDWNKEAMDIWGEHVPGMVKYPETFDTSVRPVLFLRTGSHRVTDLQVASLDSVRQRYEILPAEFKPVDALKHLKLGDHETSFFFEEGKKKGLVKGAYKRKESAMLGLLVGDTRVGQDRVFGGEKDVPRGFYTTINPLEKKESDMWDYAGFLELNGWKM